MEPDQRLALARMGRFGTRSQPDGDLTTPSVTKLPAPGERLDLGSGRLERGKEQRQPEAAHYRPGEPDKKAPLRGIPDLHRLSRKKVRHGWIVAGARPAP